MAQGEHPIILYPEECQGDDEKLFAFFGIGK